MLRARAVSAQESVDVGVCWRVVRARGVLTRVAGVQGEDGLPSPEVLRRLKYEEARRRGGKLIFKPGLRGACYISSWSSDGRGRVVALLVAFELT